MTNLRHYGDCWSEFVLGDVTLRHAIGPTCVTLRLRSCLALRLTGPCSGKCLLDINTFKQHYLKTKKGFSIKYFWPSVLLFCSCTRSTVSNCKMKSRRNSGSTVPSPLCVLSGEAERAAGPNAAHRRPGSVSVGDSFRCGGRVSVQRRQPPSVLSGPWRGANEICSGRGVGMTGQHEMRRSDIHWKGWFCWQWSLSASALQMFSRVVD